MTTAAAIPAVVLGGAVNALSIARSLGRHGVPVDVLAHEQSPLPVRHSRYCRRYVGAAAPVQEHWLRWLLDERACAPAVLLPGSDEGLELIARNRAALVARGHRPFEADDEVTLAMLDKASTYEIAARIGVAAPRALLLESPDDLDGVAGAITYPAVLKPRHSHVFLRRFAATGKGRIVSSDAEVVAAARPIVEAGVGMVLTELVPGPHDAFCSYYTFLDDDGRPLLEVTKRKLRQYPIGFGEGTYHEMAWEPEAAEIGLRFFRAVGLRGIGNVEFKRDERDGALKLIECNLRFTQADALLRWAGVDLPLFAYSRLVGWPLPEVGPQRNGIHLWFPANDLRALRDYRRAGVMTTGQWLRSLAGRQHPPLLERDDPGPTLREVRRRLGRVPGRVAGAAGRRVGVDGGDRRLGTPSS